MKATFGKEIVLRTSNEIGVLADVCKSLSDRGINLLAAVGWVDGVYAVIRLVAEDHIRALDCLRERHQPREAGVVLVELNNRVGMLKSITDRLKSEGIDFHHLYASVLLGGEKCLVVFSSSNNERAVVALSQEALAGADQVK
jgi:hypothetical protein